MARKNAVQRKAEEFAREARAALIERDLTAAVEVTRATVDGVEHWKAYSPAKIRLHQLNALSGSWYLRMYWLIAADPGGRDPQLLESSVSLNVEDSSLTATLTTDCLVRYDVDHRFGAATGSHAPAHLNVLQPGALEDRVHYPAVGFDAETWPPRAVIGFLVSDALLSDLINRVP